MLISSGSGGLRARHCDRVLFVERASELPYAARLKTERFGAEAKASLKRAKVECGRPETR